MDSSRPHSEDVPPLIMDEKYAAMGMDIIEEAITEVEKDYGYK